MKHATNIATSMMINTALNNTKQKATAIEETKPVEIIPAIKNGMRPIHPGETIIECWMKPMNMGIMELSQKSGLLIKVIKPVTKMKKPVTPEIAEGLAKAFWTSKELWLNLQATYDTRKAEISEELKAKYSMGYEVGNWNDLVAIDECHNSK